MEKQTWTRSSLRFLVAINLGLHGTAKSSRGGLHRRLHLMDDSHRQPMIVLQHAYALAVELVQHPLLSGRLGESEKSKHNTKRRDLEYIITPIPQMPKMLRA